MNSQIEIENKLKALKPSLSAKFYVDKIGCFGSFVRNEQTENSDIDIIVLFNKPLGGHFLNCWNYLKKN